MSYGFAYAGMLLMAVWVIIFYRKVWPRIGEVFFRRV